MRLPSLLAWLRTAPLSTSSSISTRSLKHKYKGDLLQVVNTPGGSDKTLALATLLAEQEEIRSRSATWQLVAGLGSCALSEDRRERAFVVLVYAIKGQGSRSL